MKFICDDNLGKLAKYLRILGFDTLFFQDIDNPSLLRIAANDERFLLTRDNKLSSKIIPHGVLLLNVDDPLVQLSKLLKDLNLVVETDRVFTRCSRCNVVCESVDKNELKDIVFPYILRTQLQIRKCPSCGRFYWRGTHFKALLYKLRKVVPGENLRGEWPN